MITVREVRTSYIRSKDPVNIIHFLSEVYCNDESTITLIKRDDEAHVRAYQIKKEKLKNEDLKNVVSISINNSNYDSIQEIKISGF